ncbi:MAG: hypothetical protein J1E64_09680, partial [Acetatifactor sp.]|nr:hypothetical protein [Acetatifactor sp.]
MNLVFHSFSSFSLPSQITPLLYKVYRPLARGQLEFCSIYDRGCRQKVGLNTARKEGTMYSEEQYHKALEVYEETGSITKTITIL